MKINNERGQSLVEYATFLSTVFLATAAVVLVSNGVLWAVFRFVAHRIFFWFSAASYPGGAQ